MTNIITNVSTGAVNLSAEPPVNTFPPMALPATPRIWPLCEIQLQKPAPVVLTIGSDIEAYTYSGGGLTVFPGVRSRAYVCGPLATSRTASGSASIPLHFLALLAVRLDYLHDGAVRTRIFDYRPGAYQLPPVHQAKARLITATEDNVGAPTPVNFSPQAAFAEGVTTDPAKPLATDIFIGSPVTLTPPAGAVGLRLALNETALPGTLAARISDSIGGGLVALQDHVNQAYWPYQTPVRMTPYAGTQTVTNIAGAPIKTVNYLIEF